jgi:diketogulonate reductase-like aldo/keto reductase
MASLKRKGPHTNPKLSQCKFCSSHFPSKTKLFRHLNSGECTKAVSSGFQAKNNLQKLAIFIGHQGHSNFLAIFRQSLAAALKAMNVEVPWHEIDPQTHKLTNSQNVNRGGTEQWSSTTTTAKIFLLEEHVPRVEEMISLSLPTTNHKVLLEVLNKKLPQTMHVWRIVGPLPNNAHLHADTDCSKRRMECIIPWSLLCPNGPISPHETNLKPRSFHQFLLGFCTRSKEHFITTASSSPLFLLSSMSSKSKDFFIREIFHFLCKPNSEQLDAMKRMKRTFQAFQGYRSLHNCAENDSLLPQNSSIRQKIERFALKGVVMVDHIGACIVVSMSIEKHFPTGSMLIMLGLGVSVYRGMLPSESIPILLRGFVEKVKKEKLQHCSSSSSKSKQRREIDKRYQTNSFRRPIPLNYGDMLGVDTVEDVGGCVIMNIRELSLPNECMMFSECFHAYWERKHKCSLVTIDGTLHGKRVHDIRSGFRRSIIDKIGAFWGLGGSSNSTSGGDSRRGIGNFLLAFEPRVAVVRQQILSLMSSCLSSKSLNKFRTHDSIAPQQYREVLRRLRLLINSNSWPETSNGRAKLIQIQQLKNDSNTVTTMDWKVNKKSEKKIKNVDSQLNENFGTAISFKRMNKTNKTGSFTVGYMPGHNKNVEPKGNILFPNLMREIFKLENIIKPNRSSSSCCAVNCNAKFMPHKDSGAGNGQQISLIVGLGNYNGGQLGVEGEVHNIRYNPIEFDGWKQRHWTLPFEGERFSLVWFSPLGCTKNDTGKFISEQKLIADTICRENQILNRTNVNVTLRNDVIMPLMGIGTFHVKGEICTELIQHALSMLPNVITPANATSNRSTVVTAPEAPIILIDTAELYNNHVNIKKALINIDRSKYFLVTKLSPKHMTNPSVDVQKAFNQSIFELFDNNELITSTFSTIKGVLDCYLMHWVAPHGSSPENFTENNEIRIQCWLEMEKLYWKGLVRSIGVSNFTTKHLQLLLSDERITVVPHVNQVEIHPLYDQLELREFCSQRGIQIQAYSSLGQANLLNHEKIIKYAKKCKLSTVQLLLYWGMKYHSLPIIPRSSSKEHIEENISSMINMNLMSKSDMFVLNATLKMMDQEFDNVEKQKFAWDSSKF